MEEINAEEDKFEEEKFVEETGEEKDEVEPVEDDEEEKKEIEQIMKDEDINLVPESVDVSEIDKLTGNPKPNGNLKFVVEITFR